MSKPEGADGAPLRLHIGGTEVREGWKILNIAPGPHVDFLGNCTSLSQFDDGSVAQIYASHVYEHLGYRRELPRALKEAYRVLTPGGLLQISVPHFQSIAALLADPARTEHEHYDLMRYLYGGQDDPTDFHKIGLTVKLLASFLVGAGFHDIRHVRDVRGFGIFDDWSGKRALGQPISLNMSARK